MKDLKFIICAAAAAALLFSAAGCKSPEQPELEAYDMESDSLVTDSEESGAVPGSNDADTLEDGAMYLSEAEGRTREERLELEEAAVSAAEACCGVIFNYDGLETVAGRLEGMLADVYDGIPSAECFDEVYGGTDMRSEFYWYAPSAVYVAGRIDGSPVITLYGTARVHLGSTLIEEGDYDAYMSFAAMQQDGEWKLCRITSPRLYAPGNVSVSWSEYVQGGVDITGETLYELDVTNPEQYLSGYKTDIRKDFESLGWTPPEED